MKRGQVTIFALLGILLLFFVGFFLFVLREPQSYTVENPAVTSVQSYVQSCFESEIDKVIGYIALQGGYYSEPPHPFTYTLDGETYLLYTPYVPNYFYAGEKYIPSVEEVESALSQGIIAFADPCLNFSALPYTVESGEMTVTSKLSEYALVTTINIPIYIIEEGKKHTIDFLEITVPTNLLHLYTVAQLMAEQQYIDQDKICVTCIARIAEENDLSIISDEFATEDTYNLLYRLQDNSREGPVFSFMYTFVFLEQVSLPFALHSIPNQDSIIGYPFTYTVLATGENITYSDDTSLFDINPSTGVISFTPSKEDVGISIITITATNAFNNTSSESFVLTIKDIASSELYVEPLPYLVAEVNKPFSYMINVSSNYAVYFTDTSDLFVIDLTKGLINFTPSLSDVGENNFVITVTDAIGNYYTIDGSIYVVK